ncbi:MAG: hypothetical protein DCF19_02645 [Pseudanabaena frigida]|uniref:Uncharacterized protein n=1 Tax=Pseudanabaena frigida TaxID=945775 RepID=A0A2W4WG48_9CYAN|nr:MAG: hypothetical protein DCF19_02645 [Pseudanabaena frigida]
MNSLIQYFAEIKLDKTILWCYLIWYVVIVSFYFDPSFKIWSNSIGISAVIGTGLMLSVSSSKVDEQDYWQTFRLYFMPFCVSSFAALIKEKGFIVFVSPKIEEDIVAVLSCLLFLLIISVIKLANKKFV